MLRSLGLIGAAVLLAGMVQGQTSEGYTVKFKRPGARTVYHVDRREEQTGWATIKSTTGKVEQPKGNKRILVFRYRETVLEQPEGEPLPARLQRRYDKAAQTIDGKTGSFPFEGKTVLIEKKDTQYVFKIEDGDELKAPDAGPLLEEFGPSGGKKFEMENRLLPGKAVRPGATWSPDLGAFIKQLEASSKWEVDAGKTTGKVKLLRLFKKDGRQFGVLDVHLQFVPRTIPTLEKRILAPPGNKVVLDLEINGCIDGSSLNATVTARIQMDTVMPAGGKDGEIVTLRIRNTVKETRTEMPN
ncbi:MAG TPA: hypothetical protein VEL76_25105 [Gemmataceae bacterium]|nr:hypothetical protein [Gemmataceae bacterium]